MEEQNIFLFITSPFPSQLGLLRGKPWFVIKCLRVRGSTELTLQPPGLLESLEVQLITNGQ